MTDENIPSPGELLDAALAYAAAGLKIYPVDIRGLRPDGKKDVHVPVAWGTAATDDVEQVYEWWGDRYAGYGIGVDTGRSGLAVADADVKDGVDGPARLAGEIGEWDRDTVSRTPSGGLHVWYRDPDGQVGSGANVFGTPAAPSGVDARGVGGTIFLPPTYVPGYGQYEWNPAAGPPRWEELPEAPAALARACPPGGRKKQESAGERLQRGLDPSNPFMTANQGVAATIVHRDRPKTLEQAQAELMPLWEQIRDTKSPNGLWQAVASFARAAAHYSCFWDRAGVGALVLEAYRAGGHGYSSLDDGDVRAIESAFQLQEQARAAGDLDEGWEAVEQVPLEQAVEQVPTDAVEALIGEMLTLTQVKELPPKRSLIQGLLHLDSEAWLIGAPGSMKSFVALSMAMHVAEGREWQDRRVHRGSVIIIAAEGAAGLGNRVRAWEKRLGWLPDATQVRVLPRPVQVADVQAWAVLVAACARLGPVLVVVDTQARVTAGLKENTAEDMGIYVAAATALRMATGACVLTVHHTGRNGGDARGSSAIDGAQDTELKVVRTAEKLRAELRQEKQKDMEEGAAIPLQMEWVDLGVNDDGDPQSSLVLLPPDAWRDAQDGGAGALEPGQEEHVPEPERWTEALVPHNRAANQRRILMVMRYIGGQDGLTEARVRTLVLSRWYGGRPLKKNEKGHMSPETWASSWSRVAGLIGQGGEPVVERIRGERWSLNEAAIPVTDE